MTESTYAMLPVPQALDIVLQQAERLPPQPAGLAATGGLILAQAVMAREPLPPFPAAIKDGYAVVAADGPGDYPVVGEATAGRMPGFTVQPGAVAYITTGAPLPAGADAVVMVEDTQALAGDRGPRRVRIGRQVKAGDDIRPVGADITAGQEVLAAGERLGPAEVGLLATVGADPVWVYPRPRVAVLSTGDELAAPGAALGPGQIRDSNGPTLRAAVLAQGGQPLDLGIAGDTRQRLAEQLQQGLAQADIVLTSGGVSMGDRDFVKPLLEAAGVVHFGRLLMKPGKPLTFATVVVAGRRKLVFGLPGNPVSSLVTFYLLAAPAMRKLAGWRDPHLPRVQVQLAQPLRLDAERPEYHRATVRWEAGLNHGQGGYLAASTGSQVSSRLLSMRSANALLELPRGDGQLEAGAVVTALLIGEH